MTYRDLDEALAFECIEHSEAAINAARICQAVFAAFAGTNPPIDSFLPPIDKPPAAPVSAEEVRKAMNLFRKK